MDYLVQPGDCISSIASRYGFFWKTLWNANPALSKLRKNPNVLLPGDTVIIPDKTLREESCATDQRHEFVKKGALAKFRLIVERFNVPLANRRFILDIDGKPYQGTTDATGMLEVKIDPAAVEGHLQMPDDDLECTLKLGHLDPLEELIGVQQRLQNLGFYSGELNGVDNDETHYALAAFQSSVDLDATGNLDDSTRQKLLLMQDQPHPQASPDTAAPDDPEAASDSSAQTEVIEPDIDPAADAAEMARFTSLDD